MRWEEAKRGPDQSNTATPPFSSRIDALHIASLALEQLGIIPLIRS